MVPDQTNAVTASTSKFHGVSESQLLITPDQAQSLVLAIMKTQVYFINTGTFAKNGEAFDSNDDLCDPLDDQAKSFCIDGAFIKENAPDTSLHRAWLHIAHKTAAKLMGSKEGDLFAFNDHKETGVIDVLRFLEQAIDEVIHPKVGHHIAI